MWPRVAWWVLSIAAIPAAKYVWDKILESPSYQDDVAKANAAKAAKEKAEKEELIGLRNKLSEAGRKAAAEFNDEDAEGLIFRKFDGVGK